MAIVIPELLCKASPSIATSVHKNRHRKALNVLKNVDILLAVVDNIVETTRATKAANAHQKSERRDIRWYVGSR